MGNSFSALSLGQAERRAGLSGGRCIYSGQNTKIEGIDTAMTKISSGSPMRQ